MASVHGCHPQLLRTVLEINRDQRRAAVQQLRRVLGSFEGRTIGVLGLSFKPNTDDMREAPSVELIHLFQNEGASIRAYDPVSMDAAVRLLPDALMCASPYQVADTADAIVVVTDWNEFKQLDMAAIKRLMRHPILFDGRNIYDPDAMAELGFIYFGVGRAQSVGFYQPPLNQRPLTPVETG